MITVETEKRRDGIIRKERCPMQPEKRMSGHHSEGKMPVEAEKTCERSSFGREDAR
jgi:hypothetical protein